MRWRIVTDSGSGIIMPDSCDLSYGVVPFTIYVDDTEYKDDERINVSDMMEHARAGAVSTSTGCPSPGEWLKAFGEDDNVIAFTLSAELSGSFNSAMAARHMALEKNPHRKIYILNTFGAGVMPERIIRDIMKSIDNGGTCDETAYVAECAIRKKKVLFALGDLDNLIKSGRLNRFAGYAAKKLSILAVGTASSTGKIEIRHKFRGAKKLCDKMIHCMKEEKFDGGELVITHCQSEEYAERLGHLIKADWPDTDVTIVAASGLCSYYMGKGGLIVNYLK